MPIRIQAVAYVSPLKYAVESIPSYVVFWPEVLFDSFPHLDLPCQLHRLKFLHPKTIKADLPTFGHTVIENSCTRQGFDLQLLHEEGRLLRIKSHKPCAH